MAKWGRHSDRVTRGLLLALSIASLLGCTAIRPLATDDAGPGDAALGDAGSASDAGAPDAGTTDAGASDGGGCQDTDPPVCLAGSVATCVGDVLTPMTVCDLGCGGDPAQCLELVPSNVPAELLGRGIGQIDLGSSAAVVYYVFNTDTGSIFGYDDNLGKERVRIRQPGPGVNNGIYFQELPGSDGRPGMGVFAAARLRLESGETAVGEGSNALVLLIAQDAVIEGELGVDADYAVDESSLRGAASEAGGQGAGQNGVNNASAGGGGSFGSAGGSGAPTSTSGPVYGGVELMPLEGGSGGGDGGGVRGGVGGRGAGALQLTAGVSITVGATGAVSACGEGGGGGGGSTLSSGTGGGGGGGSGGALLLEAPTITIDGRVAANGGGGGQGSPSSNTRGAAGQDGTPLGAPAPGGDDGRARGGAGGDGSDPMGAAGDGTLAIHGGGGGGGAGRIRINVLDDTVMYTVLPAIGSGSASVGRIGLTTP